MCGEVGKMVANLHNLTGNFDEKRPNSLDLKDWKNIYKKCLNKKSEEYNEIMYLLKNEIDYLENHWPSNIPCGVIHADLFRDNIFFKNEKISGVIDFYFSCYYFYVYDIAIVINDWCFSENGKNFHKQNCLTILEEYQKLRKLSDLEKESLNILLRAAAVRILSTRVHDYIFHPPNAIVVKKDPFEYFNILKWHQQNGIFQ
jgi:homoserine kinase type II